MKLKYYLRGLGIGMAVTAIVLGASGPKTAADTPNSAKTDNAVVLSDLAADEESKEKQTKYEEPAPEDETEDSVSEAEPGTEQLDTVEQTPQTEQMQETNQEEPETEETATETSTPQQPPESDGNEQIEITISHGDGSGTVSRKLAEAGLIESAAAYDQYLCQNGYDKKLSAGVHRIPQNATEEEIAKLLCGYN